MHLAVVNLIKKIRAFIFWLWDQEGTDRQRAIGLAVGVFSGCFPLFGLQTLLGVLLASIFKANRILAAAGTWISNPITYFPLYWFNYKVGSIILLKGDEHNLRIDGFNATEIWSQGLYVSYRLLLGSAIVGLFSGLVIGFCFYTILKRFPNNH